MSDLAEAILRLARAVDNLEATVRRDPLVGEQFPPLGAPLVLPAPAVDPTLCETSAGASSPADGGTGGPTPVLARPGRPAASWPGTGPVCSYCAAVSLGTPPVDDDCTCDEPCGAWRCSAAQVDVTAGWGQP